MPNFTAGPWIAEDEEFSEKGDYTAPQVFSCADEDNPKIVCELAVRSGMEANAHLIAAAPDMYEALKEIESEMDNRYDGADDSKTKWMGRSLELAQNALNKVNL
jgi:hypothetical protein